MGRVPYAIIGDGKVAKHFRRYFSHLEIPYRNWPAEDISTCPVVLVLISDSAIENFILTHRDEVGPEKTYVHFSGSLFTPHAIGLHPLMSFSSDLTSYSFDTYRQMVFVGEKGRTSFAQIFPDLPNPYFEIDLQQKALYHALCVVSGNFTAILWQEVMKSFQGLNLPEGILHPYLQQVAKNLQYNPSESLSGPLARQDLTTIQKNYWALDGMPLQHIYSAFLKLKGLPHDYRTANSRGEEQTQTIHANLLRYLVGTDCKSNPDRPNFSG